MLAYETVYKTGNHGNMGHRLRSDAPMRHAFEHRVSRHLRVQETTSYRRQNLHIVLRCQSRSHHAR